MLFVAFKVTSPMHSEYNVATKYFASFHNGAIGNVHQESGLAVHDENTIDHVLNTPVFEWKRG